MFPSNKRYQPLLKQSILNNKCFAPVSKNLINLKRLKWQNFVRTHKKNNRLIRNDLFFVDSKISDLQKGYTNELLYKQRFFAFFNTLKKKPFGQTFKYFKNIHSNILFINFVLNRIELRLDMILFRSNFVLTIHQARALIHSGFVRVNSNIVTSASYCLELGDLIEVVLKRKSFIFSNYTLNLSVSFLEINYETFSIVVIDKPNEKDISKILPFFFNLNSLKFSFGK